MNVWSGIADQIWTWSEQQLRKIWARIAQKSNQRPNLKLIGTLNAQNYGQLLQQILIRDHSLHVVWIMAAQVFDPRTKSAYSSDNNSKKFEQSLQGTLIIDHIEPQFGQKLH